MKVIFFHQTITDHDAIGNDIYHMYNILKAKYKCFAYCTHLLDKRLSLISKEDLKREIKNEKNLLIYHHSNYWKEGEELLREAKAKIIIKYHNLTKAVFYKKYSDLYYKLCSLGQLQTKRLYKNLPKALWMSDSEFNLKEAGLFNIKNKVIVPPFNNIEDWDNVKPDDKLLKQLLEGNTINIMFIGRIVPNKNHTFLIKIVKDYIDHYGENICLYIIGKKDETLTNYNNELSQLIKNNRIEKNVRFVGDINERELVSYYLGCDFFICVSNHEGFCVPILEAQYLYLPIIAKRATAVTSTIGKNQILLGDNVSEYSSAIKVLSEKKGYRDFIVRNGRENYEKRFSHGNLKETFKKALKEYMGVQI